MKKHILLLALLIVSAGARAQRDTSFPYSAGGFGHFYTGTSFFPAGDLLNYLEKPEVLNGSFPARIGTIAGGEGAGLLGRFIIGGGGFGQTIFRNTTDSARLHLSFGGGYFKFGYVCHYHAGNFGYVYGGVGWGGLNVHIENISDETPIRFNHRSPLEPGFKQDYSLPFNFYDIGLSYKHLFSSDEESGGSGGFMVGLDLGCFIALPSGDWESKDDAVVSGPPTPGAALNPYLRITIGGGGFGAR